MDTNRPIAKITNWYASSSRVLRILATVFLIAVALVVIQVGGRTKSTPMCSLLEDCELRSCDVQRIQLALGQSGLDEFEVEANQIKVPLSQRSTYLKVISELGALPSHLLDEPKLNANINPFMSRSQQKLIERNEKKRQIRDLLTLLPFVEKAWFEMDVAESTTLFEPDRQTAVVSIQPTDDKKLSPPEVDTIRQIVGGALAGIRGDQIVVTDLNAGRALPAATDSRLQIHQASFASEKQSREEFFESEIRRALESYPGVDFQVHYSLESRYPAGAITAPAPADSKPAPELAKPNPFDVSEDTVGVNGTASIEDVFAESDQLEPVPLQATQPFDGTAKRPDNMERVAVSLTVPQDFVETRFGTSRVKTLFGFPLEEPQADMLDNNFEKLKSELIEKVRPVLPICSFDNAESYPISVVLTQRTSEPKNGLAHIQDLVRRDWPTVAVLLIGLLMLLVVMKSKPAKTNHYDQILSIENAIAASGDESAKNEAEQKLSRLIEQDPDAAAKVIKSWIRKSA